MDTDNLSYVLMDNEDLQEYVSRQLMSYNERQSPWVLQKRMPGRGPMPLSVYLRNQEGDTFGGAIGFMLWNWLEIENLWVWDELRSKGWGTGLLATIEGEARDRGCRHVQLHTWDFQAPNFYRKRGYHIVGELHGYPPGHATYWLSKDLT